MYTIFIDDLTVSFTTLYNAHYVMKKLVHLVPINDLLHIRVITIIIALCVRNDSLQNITVSECNVSDAVTFNILSRNTSNIDYVLPCYMSVQNKLIAYRTLG